MRLIEIKPAQILELLKSAYFAQYGEQIEIGSDEFAASAAQSYAWGVLLANVNEAARNLFIETATGEYLDAIAANYGITQRPQGYRASAQFSIIYYLFAAGMTFPAGSLVVADESGRRFSNIYPIQVPTLGDDNYVHGVATLYAESPGVDYNGITPGAVSQILTGSGFVSEAQNVTETSGGTAEFPHNEAGDEAYRQWLMVQIKSFAGVGTSTAYEARAKNADSRVISAYVLRQNDAGYEKGKVQIFVYSDPSVESEVVDTVQAACDDPAFRPIGDLVVASVSPVQAVSSALDLEITYDYRFHEVAASSAVSVIAAYLSEVESQIGRPFVVDELCSRLCTPDADGIYAIDAFARNSSGSTLTVWPDPGKRLRVTGIGRYIGYR